MKYMIVIQVKIIKFLMYYKAISVWKVFQKKNLRCGYPKFYEIYY